MGAKAEACPQGAVLKHGSIIRFQVCCRKVPAQLKIINMLTPAN
jgi:hypothetical protein